MDPVEEQDLAPPHNVGNVVEDINFTQEENEFIADLKELYMETIQIDIDMQKKMYSLEKVFEVRYHKIYEDRKKLLDDFKKNKAGSMTKFWLHVLKASSSDFISENDEKILGHLVDIRSVLYNEPHIKFVIEFHFEPNEFFIDEMLTKSYYLNILPDPEQPLSYDGAEIHKCEGCIINWKPQAQRENIAEMSFFDFFSPPELPEDIEDPSYSEISDILQKDFNFGFFLKERVIEKAVLFYTGEMADCESSGSESLSVESEEEEEN